MQTFPNEIINAIIGLKNSVLLPPERLLKTNFVVLKKKNLWAKPTRKIGQKKLIGKHWVIIYKMAKLSYSL